MPFKVYFRSEFVHLFFPQSRKILKENHPFTRSDSYGHSINALVTKQHYVNSFTIYTVLAHSHLMQSSQELCERDLIFFILQKKPRRLKIQSFALSHKQHLSCQRTLNYFVFHRNTSGCCYMEIMQSCNFLSFAKSTNSVFSHYVDTQ